MLTTNRKLKDLTVEEYEAWWYNHCKGDMEICAKCPLNTVSCIPYAVTCWVKNQKVFTPEFLNQEIAVEKEKPTLTKEEKIILQNLPRRFIYITREEGGGLLVHTDKPTKGPGFWYRNGSTYKDFPFEHLFKFVKWSDVEPLPIEYLLSDDIVEWNVESSKGEKE